MFIELTDHLRCPEPHEESFLVLLPDRMDGRRVVAGHLGCPVCGWSSDWDGSDPKFGEVTASDEQPPPFDAESVLALLAVDGPGGWLALAGRMAWLADGISSRLPDVGIVAVNPPLGIPVNPAVSVIHSFAWPIKTHSMRGVAIGADAADFGTAPVQSVLPGLRVIGETDPPPSGGTHSVLESTPGLWVARRG